MQIILFTHRTIVRCVYRVPTIHAPSEFSHFYVRYQDGGGHNYNDCNCHFETVTIRDKSEKWLFRFPQIHTPHLPQLHLEFYLNFAIPFVRLCHSRSQTFACVLASWTIWPIFKWHTYETTPQCGCAHCCFRQSPLVIAIHSLSCRTIATITTNTSTSSSYLVFLTNAFGVRLSMFEIFAQNVLVFRKAQFAIALSTLSLRQSKWLYDVRTTNAKYLFTHTRAPSPAHVCV